MRGTPELQGAFRTHMHYLQAFSKLSSRNQRTALETYAAIKQQFFSSPDMPQFSFPIRDPDQVCRSLQIAWGTELLLCLGSRFLQADEVIRLSNNWNVVQAYYVLFHATQALTVARGNDPQDSHPRMQNCFIDFWARLPEAFTPWSLSVGANGHQPTSIRVDENVHSWSLVTTGNCASLACKAIRTTWDDSIADSLRAGRVTKQRSARRVWRAAEKARTEKGRKPRPEPKLPLPRLTREETEKIITGERNFSILDYLYRLRIRSNYIDAGMFTDGPEGQTESSTVRECLKVIVCTSLHATELMLTTFSDGTEKLREWGRAWSEANVPNDVDFAVKQRVQIW